MCEGVRLCTEGAIIKVLGYQTGRGVLHIARPEAVEVVRPGCRSGCGCSWREAARVVGDGVAVVVRRDAVVFVAAHGVKLLRSYRVCPSPRLEEVGACWSVCEPYTLHTYI